MIDAGCGLIILAKRPDAGRVKTRLAAEFGDEFAARAHEAMVLDLVARTAVAITPPAQCSICFAPIDAEPWFGHQIPEGWTLDPQGAGDLGERMRDGFASRFATGFSRVVLIGSDSPTLPPRYYLEAFEILQSRDVVLGPSCDGGYYLVGLRSPLRDLFSGISWSTPNVFAQTVIRVRSHAWTLGLLPPWYDIDTPDDWRMLVGHLRGMREAGLDPGLPRVEQLANPDSN